MAFIVKDIKNLLGIGNKSNTNNDDKIEMIVRLIEKRHFE